MSFAFLLRSAPTRFAPVGGSPGEVRLHGRSARLDEGFAPFEVRLAEVALGWSSPR